jgi:ribosome biogenesis protein Nip4
MINEFITNFTSKKIECIKIKNEYYHVHPKLLELKDKIPIEPESIGIFLGKQKGKGFEPSIELIKLLSQFSTKKVYINDKAAWLYICNRDVFRESITKRNVSSGLCLVMNSKEECLGYGDLTSRGIRHILDIGEYLRMER